VKKTIAPAIIVGSLFLGGISAGAQEVDKSTVKSKLTEVTGQSKAKTSHVGPKSQQYLEWVKAQIRTIKNRIKTLLAEVKPLQNQNKELISQLKVAKEKNDKKSIQALKEKLDANIKIVKAKMATAQSDIEKLKILQMELMNYENNKKLHNRTKESK
jgi:predicted RNase H-like nuclease (RuvC/YqgF family)